MGDQNDNNQGKNNNDNNNDSNSSKDMSLAKTAQRIAKLCQKHGIKVAVFDIDQTAVSWHSHGRMKRSELDDYLKVTTKAFGSIVPALHDHSIKLAIATHEDAKEYETVDDIHPSTHIVGEEYAQAVLKHNFNDEIARDFLIVSYNPDCYPDGKDDKNIYKRYHMREIQEKLHVKPEEILLLDDSDDVVQDCRENCGVHVVAVNGDTGLQAQDVLDYLEKL